MPGRSFSGAVGHRYGYQGSESDDEIYGTKNSFTTFFRQGDPRVVRWWSVDPKADEQAWQSPFSYMDGNPILLNDPMGDKPWKGEIDDKGNVSYVAEEGDNGMTLMQQYDLSTKETADILKGNNMDVGAVSNIEAGTKISGESVKKATGSEVLQLDLMAKPTDADINRQVAFMLNRESYHASPEDYTGNLNDYFGKIGEYSTKYAQGAYMGVTTSPKKPTSVTLFGKKEKIHIGIGHKSNGVFEIDPSHTRTLSDYTYVLDFSHPEGGKRPNPILTVYLKP